MDRQGPPPGQKQETIANGEFPTAGIDLSQEFELQRADTTPQGLNVRAYEPATQRMRGGSRPGVSKWPGDFPVIDPSPIQDLNVLTSTAAANLLLPIPQYATSGSLSVPAILAPGGFGGWVPVYGSGVPMNKNQYAEQPRPAGANLDGATVTGAQARSGYPVTLIDPNRTVTTTATILSGTGTLSSGDAFIAVLVGGTFYIQPPVWAS